MDGLIFFAIIIFFSILESIARNKKKKKKRMEGDGTPQIPDQWDVEDEETWRADARGYNAPTYDADSSYDDRAQTADDASESNRRGTSGSEGLIPANLWEEIARLAERAQKGSAEPRPSAPAQRAEPAQAPAKMARREAPLRPPPVVETHRVHRSHAEYGTDPSKRSRSLQDGLDPLARTLGADAGTARRQLRRGGRHALRQAVILYEVFGPPASMRQDGFLE